MLEWSSEARDTCNDEKQGQTVTEGSASINHDHLTPLAQIHDQMKTGKWDGITCAWRPPDLD